MQIFELKILPSKCIELGSKLIIAVAGRLRAGVGKGWDRTGKIMEKNFFQFS